MWSLLTKPRRRNVRTAAAIAVVCSLTGLVASAGSAAASVATDQKSIAQLEQRIAAQGAQAQSLVARYNAVQAQVDALAVQTAHAQSIVEADLAAEAVATRNMRSVAVRAYMSGGVMDSPPLALFSGTSNITTALEQNQYLGAVGDRLNVALAALQLDKSRTQDAQDVLLAKQKQAKKTLHELASARDAATKAIASDEATLTRVHGDLRTLLAAAAAKRAADEQAAERSFAAAAVRATPVIAPAPEATIPASLSSPTPTPTTSTSLPSSPPASSSGYANPFRGVTALGPERIDQGVDYTGFGPVYAIGNGVVLNTVGAGWPGGSFVAYQLSDGAARGLVVFVAEDIEASVQVGDQVSSGSVIGHMYAGPDGIETGWADGSSLPDTMARANGQFNGTNSTAFGDNFSRFLESLGAPGGVEVPPSHGSLPPSWPHW